MEQSLTAKAIQALRDMPRKPQPPFPARPSLKAINRANKILSECERVMFPYPNVFATRKGIRLYWESPRKEIEMNIEHSGEISYVTIINNYDEQGELMTVVKSDGYVESIKSMDRVMAWFLSDVAAQA